MANPAASGNVVSLAAVRKAQERPVRRLDELSFIVRRKEGRKRMCGYDHWHVAQTGNGYSADYQLGKELALEYLAFAQRGFCFLGWIVADMPRELTGIEQGFLRTVGDAAAIGVYVAGTEWSQRT
jgi:hypothetical protein